MKINGCPLFAHKYRTMVDRSEGAADSTLIIPIAFINNVLGIFCFFIVRYLYGYSILKAKSFHPALIQIQERGFYKTVFLLKQGGGI